MGLADCEGPEHKPEEGSERMGNLGSLLTRRGRLIRTLENGDDEERFSASVDLARLGDKRALEPLVAALQDTEIYRRRDAAEALGVLGDESAVEPLILALNDEASRVVENAAEAIEKIGGNRGAKEIKAMRAREKEKKEERDKEERRMKLERDREESRIDETCRELLRLLPGFREPGTLTKIRSIGERLNRAADGTTYLMSKVAYKVQATDPLAASRLDNAWDGIGYWQG